MPRDRPAYRWLIRLLPPSFREEYERELLGTWRAQAGAAQARGERPGRAWRRAFADTLGTAPREHAATIGRNLRGAWRQVVRAPGVFATAIATLALAMGATTGVFALIDQVLLRPLPFTRPAEVGLVWASSSAEGRTWLSFPEIDALRRSPPASLRAVAAFTDIRVAEVGPGGAEELQGLAVSHDLFRLLGVAPALGRDFARDDDREGAAPIVIVSDAFWRRRLGGDPAAVGRVLRLDERDYRVVGVLPAAFSLLPASSVLPDRVDVWVPLEPHLVSRQPSVRFLHALARRAPDATFARAGDELAAAATRIAAASPDLSRDGPWTLTIVSFEADVLASARSTLGLLFALVGLVLVMACANVAHLFLARAEARQADRATRLALGASRARLAGEQLAEAALVATIAAAGGLAIAAATPIAVQALDPAALPRLGGASLTIRVALFAFGLAALAALVSTTAPMAAARWLPPVPLAGGGRSGGRTRMGARVSRLLVVIETACATAIVAAAIFVAQTLTGLQRVDLGVRPDDLTTARLSLSPRYGGAEAAAFFERATEALARQPGVQRAGGISQLPLSGAMLGSTFISAGVATDVRLDVDLRAITPAYAEVAGLRLLAGRGFRPADTAAAPRVAIVDERFARRLAPGGEVIGRRIRWIRQPDVDVEIVGVAAAVRHRGADAPAVPTVYRPLAQYPRTTMFLVARTAPGRTLTGAEFRAAVATIDGTQPLADVATMSTRVRQSLARLRLGATLAGVLGGLAMALGAIGVYGVISVGVARRIREFGVRLALGATPAAVRRQVVREGLSLALAGVAVGLGGAAGAWRFAQGTLDGVGTSGVTAGAAAAGVVIACALLALALPARRAAAVEPIASLRAE